MASASYILTSDIKRVRRRRSNNFGLKRAIDIVGSIVGLIVLAPLMLLVALLVWASGKGSIIFTQNRIGLDGQIFPCLKFRTMRQQADEYLSRLIQNNPAARDEWLARYKIKRDPRVTALGRLLRRTGLDELPQLFNVLRGDMSLVGPRPIVLSEVPRYGRYFANYMSVKPGITGLWQISRQSNTSYRRRVAYDVIYSRRVSFGMDSRIMLLTAVAIARGEGCH